MDGVEVRQIEGEPASRGVNRQRATVAREVDGMTVLGTGMAAGLDHGRSSSPGVLVLRAPDYRPADRAVRDHFHGYAWRIGDSLAGLEGRAIVVGVPASGVLHVGIASATGWASAQKVPESIEIPARERGKKSALQGVALLSCAGERRGVRRSLSSIVCDRCLSHREVGEGQEEKRGHRDNVDANGLAIVTAKGTARP